MTSTRRRLVTVWAAVSATALAGCITTVDPETNDSTADGSKPAITEPSTEINTTADLEVTLDLETEYVLFTASDLATVGPVSESDRLGPSVPIELSTDGVAAVAETAREAKLNDQAPTAEIVITLNGKEINRLGTSQSIATKMTTGDWDGSLVVTFDTRTQAEMFYDRLTASDS